VILRINFDMGSVEERVKGFIEVWEKRKTGELPPADMRVTCQSCGIQVMGDDTLQFTRRGLICKGCLKKENDGHG
jgi:hypothetical protein